MEFSGLVQSSPLSVPSTDGKIIATLVQCQLILRSARSLEITRTIDVDPEFAARVSFLRWSSDRTQDEPASSRILLADQDTVHVWDRHDEKWRATINGAGGGVGKIANVEFGCNEDEIVIWSEYSAKVTVWLVVTRNSIEIKDPKFIRKGFGYRPRTGHFTLLTRAAAHDTITIHEPTTYKLLSSFNIPTTDARGLCWSPCGRWLAVWDSASSGYKILVYTADGHLFRTYTGAQGDNAGGLGVKTVEWSPLTNYLIVGGYENRVIALNRVTFSPMMFLDHPSIVNRERVPVWQEIISPSGKRSYGNAAQPICLPVATSMGADTDPKIGISVITHDHPSGLLAATRNDSTPTTVWIWNMAAKEPCSILIHHAPVKSVRWHPTRSDLLMVQCANDEPLVYLWKNSWDKPRVFSVPLSHQSRRFEVRWMHDKTEDSFDIGLDMPRVLFNDSHNFVLGYVREKELGAYTGEANQNVEAFLEVQRHQHRHPLFDSPGSSTGRDEFTQGVGEMEDTFDHRRHMAIAS